MAVTSPTDGDQEPMGTSRLRATSSSARRTSAFRTHVEIIGDYPGVSGMDQVFGKIITLKGGFSPEVASQTIV